MNRFQNTGARAKESGQQFMIRDGKTMIFCFNNHHTMKQGAYTRFFPERGLDPIYKYDFLTEALNKRSHFRPPPTLEGAPV